MTNSKYLAAASQEVNAIVGTMLDNPAASIRVNGANAAQGELSKIAALRVALTRYENELRAAIV
jgi:hypothetical protein